MIVQRKFTHPTLGQVTVFYDNNEIDEQTVETCIKEGVDNPRLLIVDSSRMEILKRLLEQSEEDRYIYRAITKRNRL